MKLNPYLKFCVSLLGVAWSAYQAAAPPPGGTPNWSIVASSVITSVLVWLVPNLSKAQTLSFNRAELEVIQKALRNFGVAVPVTAAVPPTPAAEGNPQ